VTVTGRAGKIADLHSPAGRLAATFVPRAGMLGWSLRHGGEELVAHPVELEEHAHRGEPTGIALSHPWANRLGAPEYELAGRHVRLDLEAPNVHADANGLPIHGLVSGTPHWELLDVEGWRIMARLRYHEWPELRAGFPFPHVLRLTAELSDRRLEIETELIPAGSTPVPVAFGFHPYLRVPGVPRRHWWLELPVTSRVVLDERMLPRRVSQPVTLPPAPLGERTFDDHFDGFREPADFVLAGGGRRLALRLLEGYRFAQVYAPPGGEYVSFEPMTAPIDPFRSPRTRLVAPGSSHRARFDITVDDE
jgi:aldose 1-epimerase